MDPKFTCWIIKQHEQMDPNAKQDFLRAIKFSPDKVVQLISSNLRSWVITASFELGTHFAIHSLNNESQELLKAFQKYFAKDMAEVTK